MINEKIKLKGSLNVVLYDENKNIKDERAIPNLVVAVGKEYIAQRMESNVTPVMSHMAVGTGNVAPTVGDTFLLGEIDRLVLDSTTRNANVLTYVTTFPAGNATGTIAEAGIFNDPTANTGTMLCRTRFNEVNKGAADVVVITWNVTVE
jgi:hypothetical protein